MSNKYTYQDPKRVTLSEAVKELAAFERQLRDSLPWLKNRQTEYQETLAKGSSPSELAYAMLLYAKNVALVSCVIKELADRIAAVEASARRITRYLARHGKKFHGANKALWQMDVLGAYEEIRNARSILSIGRKEVEIDAKLQAQLKAIIEQAVSLAPSANELHLFPFGG